MFWDIFFLLYKISLFINASTYLSPLACTHHVIYCLVPASIKKITLRIYFLIYYILCFTQDSLFNSVVNCYQ